MCISVSVGHIFHQGGEGITQCLAATSLIQSRNKLLDFIYSSPMSITTVDVPAELVVIASGVLKSEFLF